MGVQLGRPPIDAAFRRKTSIFPCQPRPFFHFWFSALWPNPASDHRDRLSSYTQFCYVFPKFFRSILFLQHRLPLESWGAWQSSFSSLFIWKPPKRSYFLIVVYYHTANLPRLLRMFTNGKRKPPGGGEGMTREAIQGLCTNSWSRYKKSLLGCERTKCTK